ncbi:hemerythrin domain-containing protein [Terasakiella pusilla]|uniref:hemerythrin domain-containing protein n=1 Tax=Terasakiella pusilla TaxID=64973 RepID=UPI003AA8BB6B
MQKTITIIRTEHRRLAAIINCFVGVLTDLKNDPRNPDVELLDQVHTYCRSFLYQFHHPKEDGHLFPALLKARPDLSPIIEKLESEHQKGVDLLDEMDKALLAYKENPKKHLDVYLQIAQAYRDFEWKHMATEEKEILPQAQKSLSAETWEELDKIFSDHDDPVFGDAPQSMYENLLSQIVNRAPSPHGLG